MRSSKVEDGDNAVVGLRRLSTEVLVEWDSSGSWDPEASFLRLFRLSISSWPLSKVKDRNASNRFLFFTIAYINSALPNRLLVLDHATCIQSQRMANDLLLY